MSASGYPFTAVVGAERMSLALILSALEPAIGGVLVRGEKGTAKSTMVRSLAAVMPQQHVIDGCRYACDPQAPDAVCPDGPHQPQAAASVRASRLVELPVGATEDRVVGSLDLGKALGQGQAAFEPGLLARANRGILYVDEVNLLADHLVDVLLDAAAMGRNTVEREGVSVSHAARVTLVGTMNPEEGELRPQLLDRFGLTVEASASREPSERAEVVRRRLAFDADPAVFAARYAESERDLTQHLCDARERLKHVKLTDWALDKIAVVCAGFDVDGMRADIVTARAAVAHAAWAGRAEVVRADIREAALLALPHRRRRNPFDAPGLDEDLLDELLGDDDPTPPGAPDDTPDDDAPGDRPAESPEAHGDDPQGSDSRADGGGEPDPPAPQGDGEQQDRERSSAGRGPADDDALGREATDEADGEPDGRGPAPALGVARASSPFATRTLTVRGIGEGDAGRRSKARTTNGRVIGEAGGYRGRGTVHVPATIRAAATDVRPIASEGGERVASCDERRLEVHARHLRRAMTLGRESNLVLFAVDASGSMAARRRMEAVKNTILSLLLDAYRRRDRVGLVSFRGSDAELSLPPTHSVDAAAARLAALPHGGRTPLAEGLQETARTLRRERIRDPKRRALVVIVTDGRATSGTDALLRAERIADAWCALEVDTVVVDCESGRMRMGLARALAARMGAEYLALEEVAAGALEEVVTSRTTSNRTMFRKKVA